MRFYDDLPEQLQLSEPEYDRLVRLITNPPPRTLLRDALRRAAWEQAKLARVLAKARYKVGRS